MQCAKPQEFPLSVFLSLPFYSSLSLLPAFSDRPMREAGGMTTEPARISFLFSFYCWTFLTKLSCSPSFLCLSHVDSAPPQKKKGCVLRRPLTFAWMWWNSGTEVWWWRERGDCWKSVCWCIVWPFSPSSLSLSNIASFSLLPSVSVCSILHAGIVLNTGWHCWRHLGQSCFDFIIHVSCSRLGPHVKDTSGFLLNSLLRIELTRLPAN